MHGRVGERIECLIYIWEQSMGSDRPTHSAAFPPVPSVHRGLFFFNRLSTHSPQVDRVETATISSLPAHVLTCRRRMGVAATATKTAARAVAERKKRAIGCYGESACCRVGVWGVCVYVWIVGEHRVCAVPPFLFLTPSRISQ